MCRYRHGQYDDLFNEVLEALRAIENILVMHSHDLDMKDKEIRALRTLMRLISK